MRKKIFGCFLILTLISTSIDSYSLNAYAETNSNELLSLSCEDSDTKKEIPDWIRNNAGWWATDQISDSEFLGGIKYLIEKNIIVISNSTYTDELICQIYFELIKIQDDDVLDPITRGLLTQIPYLGDVLVNFYNDSKESREVKNDQLLAILKNIQKMNDGQLKNIEDKVGINILDLETLKNGTTKILEELDWIKNNLKNARGEREDIKNYLTTLFTELGIEQKIDFNKSVEVSTENSIDIVEKTEHVMKIDFMIKELTNTEPEKDVDYLLRVASFYFHVGDYVQSIRYYELALESSPQNDSNIMYNLAVLYDKRGDYFKNEKNTGQMIESYKEAIENLNKIPLDYSNHKNGKIAYNLGLLHMQIGGYAKEAKITEQIIESYKEAIVQFEKALLVPSNEREFSEGSLYYNLGVSNMSLSNENDEYCKIAIDWFNKVPDNHPQYIKGNVESNINSCMKK